MLLVAAATWWSCLVAAYSPLEQTNFTPQRLLELRNETKNLFLHAWNAYDCNALPMDELRPLSCEGVGPDPDVTHIQRNDVMGNLSITLLDSLDMFPILGEHQLFEHYVEYVRDNVQFDQPYIVQVFEITIRAMGGLLSAHMYASIPQLGHAIEGYDGHLLAKAYDLGLRLLPAFDTPTGIPHPRVHLQHGVTAIGDQNITETCSAGAGSLLLEFGLLSRLTNDPRFDKLAKRACFKIWSRRNKDNLVGMGIDAITGKWLDNYTSIGSSIDSYYECVLKYATLFNDSSMREIWDSAYESIQDRLCSGFYYHLVAFYNTDLMTPSVDALSAFWAGVQVLAGEISDAVRTHIGYMKLWSNWGGIPERWTLQPQSGPQSISLEWYLLRPEFLESTFYLYQATQDPIYLQTGQVALADLIRYNKVPCGVAATQDVRTGQKSDRMDSFFLSETLKYLYLLFDPENALNRDGSNLVFSTEAHPFWSSEKYLREASVQNFPSIASNYEDTPGSILEWAYSLLQPWIDAFHDPMPAQYYCEAWASHGSHSIIGSWPHFYQLDQHVHYIKPQWLERGEIEFEYDFYRHFVVDNAQCVASNYSMFR